MAGTSGLTYGVDITSRTQLVDGLNSQRIFFDDESGINELEPSEAPFLSILLGTAKKKASGTEESYIEHRGSWIADTIYYLHDDGNVGALAALEPNVKEYTGLEVAATAGGAALDTNTMQAGSVFLLMDPTDETKYASGLVTSTSAGVMKWRLLTRTPGFSLVEDAAGATLVIPVSRMFGEGSLESEERYEKPVTMWNEIGSFKESYEITDQLEATSQIVYGNELLKQLAWAQSRMKRDVDRALLYASRRTNLATATNPFSAIGSAPVYDNENKMVHASISLDQAVRAADVVGIGGTRVFELDAATMTPDDLDLNIIEQYRYGSESKKIIAGAGALQALITMSRKNNQYIMTSGDNAFGLKWKKYITPNAEMDITVNRGFTGWLNNVMFVIDPKYIQLRQLIPMYTEKLTGNSTAKKWEMRWDIGLRVKMVEAHGLWFIK